MRKFLLGAMAIVMALWATAAVPQPSNRTTTLKSYAFDCKIEKRARAFARNVPAKRINSFADLAQDYVGYYETYLDDYAPVFCNVSIEQGATETDFIIRGLWGSTTRDLNATLDPVTGTLTIPRQAFNDPADDTPADFVNAEDTTAAVTATVYAFGIMFNEAWGAKIKNKTEYYEVGMNTVLYEPNAKMSYSGNTKPDVNLYIEQSSDTAYIGNFGDYGVVIHAVLATDSTFTIEPQYIMTTSNGDYYTTDVATWYFGQNQFQQFGNITGTGTENTLTSTCDRYGWAVGTTSGYWSGGLQPNFTITRLDDDVFVYVQPTTEPELKVGDVNGDNTVDVSDVNAAINIVLKNKTIDDYPGNADMNGDGTVDVSDVNAIINIILAGTGN